jgi:hypothetical protein
LQVVIESVNGGCDLAVAGGSDVRASEFGGLGPWDVEGKVWGSIAALSSFDFDTAADVLKGVKTTWARDSELTEAMGMGSVRGGKGGGGDRR